MTRVGGAKLVISIISPVSNQSGNVIKKYDAPTSGDPNPLPLRF
jgi:hypothetical protein